MKLKPLLIAVFSLAFAIAAAWSGYALLADQAPQPGLANWVPTGSLLTIESRDFSVLLHDWQNSSEAKAWMGSDNYAGFSRSRLFSRLGEAQDQFAATAGLDPDTRFLSAIAGKESIFAWYDIGNLEFLYITRMEGNTAQSSPLMNLRSKFQQRQVEAETFYTRTDASTSRTVAFAVHGDFLILGTSETAVAGSLLLMQHPTGDSLATEGWYTGAVRQAARPSGDLRMTLNLDRIVPSPYFRSYWIQQNITEMKGYTAAITDLYREPAHFREERTLIPRDDTQRDTADLSTALQYLPADIGVYRAIARPSAADVVAALNTRIFGDTPASSARNLYAPAAIPETQSAGDTANLETRIDQARPSPADVDRPNEDWLALLRDNAPLSLLTFASSSQPQDSPFISLNSGLVLTASKPWDPQRLQSTIVATMHSRFTVAGEAIRWTDHTEGPTHWLQASGLHPVALAINGNTLVLAANSATLQQMLAAASTSHPSKQEALSISGFHHTSERQRLLQLAHLLDHGAPTAGADTPPPFLSGQIASLSTSFAALDSERFAETWDNKNHLVHQTVLYIWHR